MPDPDTAEHGDIGALEVIEGEAQRTYIKEYFVHGFYEDGTLFNLGPMKRQVAAEYINLHNLSLT